MPKLLTVTYANPQAAADRLVPLGWCSQCVAEAKMAELAGAEPVPVRAAVTAIPSVQQVPVPGQGSAMAVVPLPACWEHITVQRGSSLLSAPAGALAGK